MRKIYIFGAHSRALTLAQYLKTTIPTITVEAFLVDNDESNPAIAAGAPVLKLNSQPDCELNTGYTVYIATKGVYHASVISKLISMGFRADNIIPVTPQLDIELRNEYLKIYYENRGREFCKIEKYKCLPIEKENLSGISLYVAKSIYDNASGVRYDLQTYEKEIQVGAALTDVSICEASDDTEDNISGKNRQFCELTALYWVWKNSREDIVGLEHYRRHFILPDNWLSIMQSNNIDVILPTPLYVAPSLGENYRSRHVEEDWHCMMSIIRELYPDRYEAANAFFENTSVYSPCNMFIMKKAVLDEYCEWLFPILFECEKRIGQHGDTYQNRYPGFMSERLLSFYFDYYRDKYTVVYADKNFLN